MEDILTTIIEEINKLEEYDTEIVSGGIDTTISKREVLAIIKRKVIENE